MKSEDKFGSGPLILDILEMLLPHPFKILINLILIIFYHRLSRR